MSAVAEFDRETESTSRPRPEAGTASEVVARAESRGSSLPSEEQLLDVLYEVLAHGVPERSALTREEVERLLHEHARAPKPIEELARFFEDHGLPFDASAYGADQELGELASGLLRQRSSLLVGFAAPEGPESLPVPAFGGVPPLPAMGAAESEPTGRHVLEARERDESEAAASVQRDLEAFEREQEAVRSVARLRTWAWAGACAALALLAAFSYSEWQALALERRLEQARMQQLSTDAALTKLEQRAEQLTGQLKQSEDDRHGLNARFDAILSEEARKRASEEEALERLLGSRYRKLRQKVAEEAAIAAP